jgi:hypothetical protein
MRPIPHKECVVWTYFSFAAAVGLIKLYVPHADQIINWVLAKFPETQVWETVEATLRGFFWTEKTMLYWKSCWASATERWNAVGLVDPATS